MAGVDPAFFLWYECCARVARLMESAVGEVNKLAVAVSSFKRFSRTKVVDLEMQAAIKALSAEQRLALAEIVRLKPSTIEELAK